MEPKSSIVDDEKFELELSKGRTLTEEKAANLEKKLAKTPDNPAARIQLISFYFGRNGIASFARVQHLVWLIGSNPEADAWTNNILASADDFISPKSFSKLRETWIGQCHLHPNNPKVFGNSGYFLIDRDFETGIKLMTTAIELAPENYHWPNLLSEKCFNRAYYGLRPYRFEYAKDALFFGEKFLANYGSGPARVNSALRENGIIRCATCAYWLSDFAKAFQFAKQHIELVSNWSSLRPKSGLSLLGLIALKNSDIDQARKHLLTLDDECVVGYLDVELANEFVMRSDFDTALEYLKKCKRYGLLNVAQIEEWIRHLEKGQKIVIKKLR